MTVGVDVGVGETGTSEVDGVTVGVAVVAGVSVGVGVTLSQHPNIDAIAHWGSPTIKIGGCVKHTSTEV